MDAKTLKKLADQLDRIASEFSALSATFRGDDGDDGDSGADASAGKPVRGASKPAAKKSKPAPTEDEAPDIDTVREKLKELAETKGKEAMVSVLAGVGAAALKDVDESQYQELIDAAQEALDAEETVEEDEPPAKKPAAKKTTKAKGPTLAEVQAAAGALIEADKPAYLKLAKKLGKPSEMDASNYAAALAAYEAAMPAEEEAEEDLL